MSGKPSWPFDGGPRFVATAIARGDGNSEGYVLDRAYCHRGAVTFVARQEATALGRAEVAAAELERRWQS